MISKRTAIILIIAIIAIITFETNFGFKKMEEMQNNVDHTTAQITLNIDGSLVDLKDVPVTYRYDGAEKALSAKLGAANETGYENLPNNAVAFKPCAEGSNKLTFTVPQKLIPGCSSDLTVNFGCENNTAEFNSFSLIVDLTTTDEANIKADIKQTLYYPDENGNALNKKATASAVVNGENSSIDCIIK